MTKIASKAPRFFADSYWAVGLAIESCWLKKSLRLRSLPLVTSPHSQNIRIQPRYFRIFKNIRHASEPSTTSLSIGLAPEARDYQSNNDFTE
jgi:hypothetical protein